MPKQVTCATAIDAISHAVETYVTTKGTTVSRMFSRSAWRLLIQGLPTVLEAPDNLEARGQLQLGAHWAGAAIENSMLGAAHALSNPLTAHFGTTHGEAIGILLPHVVRYNQSVVGNRYGELASDLGICSPTDPAAANLLADFLTQLVQKCDMPTSLEQAQIDANLIPQMATEAEKQWTGQFNPKAVDANSLEEIYRCAFS